MTTVVSQVTWSLVDDTNGTCLLYDEERDDAAMMAAAAAAGRCDDNASI